MRNPFLYGQAVTGEHFCNRVKELEDIARHVASGQNLFIYSGRRLGKTSLVRQALGSLSRRKKVIPIFVDMERVNSRGQFVEAYARAIANEIAKRDKMERVRGFFRSLVPRFDVSSSGEVSVSVEFARSESALRRCLDEVMELPQQVAVKFKQRVAVVFDEFQEVEHLDGDHFEKYLRSFIQHHRDVCYLFLGSKAHVMIEMFNDPKRAFYRSAAVYPLKSIPAHEILKHVRARFADSGKGISEEAAERIINLANVLPNYVQMLAWHVWEVCSGEVEPQDIDAALDELLRSQGELFQTWYGQATLNQRAVLYALSWEKEIFSQDVIARYDLGAASTVQGSMRSLLKKGLVQKENGGYALVDPFFAMWLRSERAGGSRGR